MLEENLNGSSSSSSTYDMNGHRMAQNSSTEQSSSIANGTSANNCGGGEYTTNGIMNHNSHHDYPLTQQNQNIQLDNTNRDIVRLIGQHLKLIGLERTAQMLMQESGCTLEHPAATKFREHVLSGDWHKADYDLQELQAIVDDDKLTKHNLIEMKFLLLEQKYLEYLDDSRPIDALHVLRNELTPLQHNTPRVHQLSSYMMCTNNQVNIHFFSSFFVAEYALVTENNMSVSMMMTKEKIKLAHFCRMRFCSIFNTALMSREQ